MDKELLLKIRIDGVSNEAAELAKLEIQLKNLKRERDEIIKQASRPGHFTSNEERLRLAAYNKEIKEQEAALKTLKRVVDSASDSLARKKALLIELKEKSDKATTAVREGMAPAIKRLNDEISKSEQANGIFSRNVGNYANSIKSFFSELLMGGAIIAGATKLFDGLKDAIMSTTFAIDAMNQVTAVSKQIFYDLAVNQQINIDKITPLI